MFQDHEENEIFTTEIGWSSLRGTRSVSNHVSIENDATVSKGLTKIIR